MASKFKWLAPFINRSKQKDEDGNAVDLMAGVFTMVLIFVATLVMAAYGSLVDKKLAINSVVKSYLYIAEQQGGLTATDVENLKSSIAEYGATVNSVKVNGTTNWVARGNGYQVPYGDRIDLVVTVTINNPVYAIAGTNDDGSNSSWFRVGGIAKTITYVKKLSSISRW